MPDMSHDFAEQVVKYCRQRGYSRQYRVFWIRNKYCEVCLEACVFMWTAAPHHIRTRGAGGDDNTENLLPLCTSHHTEIHQIGTMTFAEEHPCVGEKIRKARERRSA